MKSARSALAIVSLLLAVAAIEMLQEQRHASRALGDYAALRDPVEKSRREGEPLVMNPQWAAPHMRKALGEELVPLSAVITSVDARLESVLVVNVDNEPHRFESWPVAPTPAATIGRFTIQRHMNPEHLPPTFDFLAAFSPDVMRVALAGKACPYRSNAPVTAGNLGGHPTFARQRFQCPGGEFFHVGLTTIANQSFAPRRCLWAHPPRDGELSIQFKDVPLGTQLVGHGGIYWMVERERAGAPVQLSVYIDGAFVGRTFHADGDGWAAFRFPLGEHAEKPRAVVEWRVASPDNRHRHYCFEALSQ